MLKLLFQIIHFSFRTRFISTWPIDKTLSDTTTPSQSEPGSDSNEGVLRIPQSFSITRTSPSDCLVSSGHSLDESYLSGKMQSVYSTDTATGQASLYRMNSAWCLSKFFTISKFESLAQFLVYHFSHPYIVIFVFFLSHFVSVTCYRINCFISVMR